MTSASANSTILEPLFAPWAEPNAHRIRAEKPGDPAAIEQEHKISSIELVNFGSVTPIVPDLEANLAFTRETSLKAATI
jgi:hypothetical protein